jgi:hypothetical protein
MVPTGNEMTPHEKALLRLEAFKTFNGWGTVRKDEDGKEIFVHNTIERQQELAEDLYRWLVLP